MQICRPNSFSCSHTRATRICTDRSRSNSCYTRYFYPSYSNSNSYSRSCSGSCYTSYRHTRASCFGTRARRRTPGPSAPFLRQPGGCERRVCESGGSAAAG